jgi:hypothetical protein
VCGFSEAGRCTFSDVNNEAMANKWNKRRLSSSKVKPTYEATFFTDGRGDKTEFPDNGNATLISHSANQRAGQEDSYRWLYMGRFG